MADNNIEIKQWIYNLEQSHALRMSIQKQTETFYYRRRLVENAIKFSFTTSLFIALAWGGPAALLLAGATFALTTSMFFLNRFTPSQYVETDSIQANEEAMPYTKDLTRLASFRKHWKREEQHYFFAKNQAQQQARMQRMAYAFVLSFAILALPAVNFSLMGLLITPLFAMALSGMADESAPLYVEDQNTYTTIQP